MIGIFSGTAFSQCKVVIVPPYTSSQTGDDFEIKRSSTGGINNYIFHPNGRLKYKGEDFRPAVLAQEGIVRFEIYTHRDYSLTQPNGRFSEGLAIAIPKRDASNAVTIFYVLDMDNCRSRKVAIRSLNLGKVIWSSKNDSTVILRDAEGGRFALVNVKTGKVILSDPSKENHPCGEPIESGGDQSVKSIGSFKGSINDLFPAKIGNFHKTYVIDNLDDSSFISLNVTELSVANYESSNGCRMKMGAAKFASFADAKEGLKSIKENNRLLIQGERKNNKVGVKKSGRKIIGERVVSVIISQDSTPRAAAVLWTNGSVLFIAEGNADLRVLLAFEKYFPY
jgi:hypothetical protein